MISLRTARRYSCTRGFTLIELALTLAIFGVLAAGLLVPFVAQVTQRKVAETERALESAREVLLGFAAANGRLPCPATDASNGVESFAGGGSAANGACATFSGFLPAVTLGFTPIDGNGYAIDAWATRQNRLRYAVSNETLNAVTNPFTRTDGMRQASAGALGAATLLYVCASAAPSADPSAHCGPGAPATGGTRTLTANAPAVVWSNGANAAIGGAGADEAQNPNPNGGSADRIFVSRGIGGPEANEFDDLLTWLSVGSLVNRMVLSGQLP